MADFVTFRQHISKRFCAQNVPKVGNLNCHFLAANLSVVCESSLVDAVAFWTLVIATVALKTRK